MAGGHGSPVRKLKNLSKTELLLHKVAMNRLKNRPRKVPVEKKPSTIQPSREFVLENHKLKNKVDQLEKEKQQWIHRHNDDAHTFRMSVRLPPQCGQEYWTQYGENFHANGDFRESYCMRLPPQPSPKQQLQSRKERQAFGDISKNNKSRPCTTVSDLISMMRETAPPSTACPLSSSSMTGELSNQNLDSAESESLEKLRVLLENYEMFVPSDSDVEYEEEEEDKTTWQNVMPENNDKQSRSKSVDDIKKVDLGVSKEKANRLTRSQSAQTNQGIQSQQRFRKRNSAPATDIAHGALRVHALQPSLCKFDIKNYSVTKNSTTLFQSPSKRVLARKEESSCSPLESNAKRTDSNDDDRVQSQIPRRIDTKSKHTDSSVKERPVDRNNSPEGLENTSRVKKKQKGLTDKEKDVEQTDKLREESSYNITYSFCDSRDVIESYSNAGGTHPVRKSFARFPAGYQREATTMSRMSRDSRSRYTHQESSPKSKRASEGVQPGKLSIKNLIPEFPLDVEALRRASRKSVTSVNDDSTSSPKQQLHWRTKPKSASSFGKKSTKSTAHDVKEMNKQPEHLTHGSVKARRTAIMVLGKGLIDKKTQEKETRDRMNQFFARLESTNGETSELHAAAPTRPNTAILLRPKDRRLKKQEYQRKTEKMYKRAAPWPVQVWC